MQLDELTTMNCQLAWKIRRGLPINLGSYLETADIPERSMLELEYRTSHARGGFVARRFDTPVTYLNQNTPR